MLKALFGFMLFCISIHAFAENTQDPKKKTNIISCWLVRNEYLDSYKITTTYKNNLTIQKVSRCVESVRKNVLEILEKIQPKIILVSNHIHSMTKMGHISCSRENNLYVVWFENKIPENFESLVNECFLREMEIILTDQKAPSSGLFLFSHHFFLFLFKKVF